MEEHPWHRDARRRSLSREEMHRSDSRKAFTPRQHPAGGKATTSPDSIWQHEDFPALTRPARGRARAEPAWRWDEDQALKLLQGKWLNVEDHQESYVVYGRSVRRRNQEGTKDFPEHLCWEEHLQIMCWGSGARYYLTTPNGYVTEVCWAASRKGVRGFSWTRPEDFSPQWDGTELEQRTRAQSEQPSEAVLCSSERARRRSQRMARFTGRVARRSQCEVPVLETTAVEEAKPAARRRRSSQRVCWKEKLLEESPEPELKPKDKEQIQQDVDLEVQKFDEEVTALASKLAAAAEAVKAATSPQERKEMEEAFKAAHIAAAKALQQQARLACGPDASDLDVASEVALQLSLLMTTGAPAAERQQAEASRASRTSTGMKDIARVADVSAADRSSLAAPPTSNFWDFPLSRHEKKARVLMINQHVAELDRMSLVEKIHALKEGKDIDDEDSDDEN
mmetsp:Transcript_93612/g.166560  ORF Transcript_93612/g.166560 Transcript_93612/m.166560 type:complete len:452 (+) Transcript_93612:74-1429(+)